MNKKPDEQKSQSKLSKIYLENILKTLPEPIYWIDKEGAMLGCNEAEAKLYDLAEPSQLLGKNTYELGQRLGWSKELIDGLRSNDKEIMQIGISRVVEEVVTSKKGELKTYLSHKAPLLDEKNEIIGIIGTSIDITELKETQKALAEQIKKTESAYRSKGEFLSTVSHEVRNPISNVITYQNIVKEKLDELQDFFFEKVFAEINRLGKPEIAKKVAEDFKSIGNEYRVAQAEAQRSLNALINLGNLHQMQLYGVVVKDEINSVNNLLEDSISFCATHNFRNIKFQSEINPGIPPEIQFDYANIKQALCIIIGNAMRFSAENDRIKIKVSSAREDEKDNLKISIQDFGVGISPEQLKTIFVTLLGDEEHTRESIYRKPSVQLPQAKLFVEASGGSLEIQSMIDQGTTVYITVPFKISSSINELNQTTGSLINQNSNCYVLLIEDDLVIQKATRADLELLKYRVDVVDTGRLALKKALENDYDIALLDISLPDMSGLEVMRQVRLIKEDKMIFIAVTSHANDEDEEHFISEGVMTVLRKPVTKLQLKSTIAAAMKVKASLNDEK